jgi:hypothetical protein
MSGHLERFNNVLPAAVDGWAKQGKGTLYDHETLFDYIDGGAELYLSYDFKVAASFVYKKEGAPEINVDIFDMGEAKNAFGVFSQSREVLDNRIGQGMEYAGGLLTFWKDRYYVSLLAYPETEGAKGAVFQLARAIEGSIDGTGKIPRIVELLPHKGLRLETVRYFRHYIWINSHYFISTENILDIERDCEAVLAEYNGDDAKHFVLMVHYPTDERAQKAYAGFMKSYLPDAGKDGTKKIEDGKWSGAAVMDTLLVVVLNSYNKDNIFNTINIVKTSIGRKDL